MGPNIGEGLFKDVDREAWGLKTMITKGSESDKDQVQLQHSWTTSLSTISLVVQRLSSSQATLSREGKREQLVKDLKQGKKGTSLLVHLIPKKPTIKNSAGKMASSSSYNSPCAACKFLRRKCMPGCIFAPYFPPEEPQKFANVHKIFGASNVTKLLNELLPHQREDAVNSLAYEAEARVRDPVYGCVGAISFLQRQVQRLQKELDAANADLLRYSFTDIPPASLSVPPGLASLQQVPQRQFSARIGNEASGFYRQSTAAAAAYSFPYSLPWTDTSSEDISEGGGAGGNL
ncbi:hypothetical protein VNO77_24723 [Canavalia gladiata]|uniref:LOB domain-containing protein n=1 Tax=Canavalia gladiata TaxID=3824 RepID=A0AAN9QGJ3_CANGL